MTCRSIVLCALLGLFQPGAQGQGRYLLTGHWNADSLRQHLVSRDDWTPFPAYADRGAWDKIADVYRKALIRHGEQLLGYSWRTVPATAYLAFVRTGDIFGMQSISDENFGNLRTLVLAELCEGKSRFMDQIVNGVWALCERSSWVLSPHLYMQKAGVGLPDVEEPVIDLFASNSASLLAWTSYFFRRQLDSISPLVSRRIRYEIQRRVLQPFYQRDDLWWMALKGNSFVNNWNIWINSNILSCILLMEDDPARRVQAIYKTMSSVDRFLNGYPADGACEEGPMYWFRAGGNVYRYLILLSRATRGHIDLFGDPLIRGIGRYIQRVHIAGDYYLNFADATARIDQDPGLIFRYGQAIQDTALQRFGSFLAHWRHWDQHIADAESLELSLEDLLQAGEVLGAGTEPLPRPAADWFPDSRIAIARDKAGSDKGFYFAAKAGNNGAGHGHNDAGSFVLYYDGHPLFIDVGRAAYTRQTFGPERYTLWYNRSDYHNLVRINGVDQQAGGRFAARGSMFSDSGINGVAGPTAVAGPAATFSSDIRGAYPDSARCSRWVRSYRLDRGSAFTISDDYHLMADKGNTCIYFMTADRPEEAGPGRLDWHLTGMGRDSAVQMTYDKHWRVSIEPITLTDTVMLQSWPSVIYRIVFRPPAGGSLSGKDRFVVRARAATGTSSAAAEKPADLILPRFISDSMIVQRNRRIPVWGWSTPGERITVRLNGKERSAVAGRDGKWLTGLPPMEAGGPYELTIRGERATRRLKGILVGDVWICSGQSNMEFEMNTVKEKYAAEIASSANDHIRAFTVLKRVGYAPQEQVESEGWKTANPVNTLRFSAAAYFFARELYRKYGVPIGLIATYWSGTPAQAWTSLEGLNAFPDYLSRFAYIRDSANRRQLERAGEGPKEKWGAVARDRDPGFHESSTRTAGIHDSGRTQGTQDTLHGRQMGSWADPDFDATGWKTMSLPGYWEDKGLRDFDGIVWLRREVMVPAELAGKDAILSLSYIDDMDSSYFNGQLAGTTDGYLIPRRYTIPGRLVRAGRNTIVIRVVDIGGNGGLYGNGPLQLSIGKDTIPLDKEWAYRVALPLADLPPYPRSVAFYPQYEPSVLYNAMIAPLIPFAIKGVIWYQGEANTGKADEYRRLFPALIDDWRRRWGQRGLPFLFVQLANFNPAKETPVESPWAALREAQRLTLALPNTGMAVTLDIGEADNIHPKDKKDVGLRLALAAERTAYGDLRVVSSGPAFKKMTIAGGKAVLSFTNVGGGLVIKGGGDLKYFAIAGADKKFVWARAVIEGRKVIVWNDSVPLPVEVRYAWADNPMGANLYNSQGLPASSFQATAK